MLGAGLDDLAVAIARLQQTEMIQHGLQSRRPAVVSRHCHDVFSIESSGPEPRMRLQHLVQRLRCTSFGADGYDVLVLETGGLELLVRLQHLVQRLRATAV